MIAAFVSGFPGRLVSCHASYGASERRQRVSARRSPQGIPCRIAKGCNAAMARCRRSLLFRVAEEVRGIMAELGHR